MALTQGVFNVTDPKWNISPNNGSALNRANLQTLISTLLDSSPGSPTGGNGGTIEFPSIGIYTFSGPAIVIGRDLSNNKQPYAIIIQGDGQGSEAAPILQKTDGGDFFQIDNSTQPPPYDDHVGGVTFRDLQIDYSTVQTSGSAIHSVNGQNVRIFRCVFQDCPKAVHFEQCLQGAMIDCTVLYPTPTVAGVALTLGNQTSGNSAVETYVAGCIFNCKNFPTGSVGIEIYNVEHARIMNTRIEGFNQGIVIAPGGFNVRKVHFGNVSCFPNSASASVGAAVLIQPSGGNWVAQVTFAECELDGPDGTTHYTGGGVVIDPINGSGGGGIIDQVRFVDCHVCKWPGPGLLILGGSSATAAASNIEVVGGYYSLNGSGPTPGLPSAGIAVIGGSTGPSGVRITGAACNNSVFDVPPGGGTGEFLPGNQAYGISIAVAQHVFVRACDLRGNVTQAVTTSGTLTDLQISECPSYNDQGQQLHNTIPASGFTFGGYTYGYYGPVEFYTAPQQATINSITVDGHTTFLTSGSFLLQPGESAAISWTPVGTFVPSFVMIGK